MLWAHCYLGFLNIMCADLRRSCTLLLLPPLLQEAIEKTDSSGKVLPEMVSAA